MSSKKEEHGIAATAAKDDIENDITSNDISDDSPNETTSSNKHDKIPDDSTKPNKNLRGTLSQPVGTGKHARTNIIWYIVSAIFVIFSCISSALIIMSIYGKDTKAVSESIKDIWGVFTPVLTLALGYLFGKQKTQKKKE